MRSICLKTINSNEQTDYLLTKYVSTKYHYKKSCLSPVDERQRSVFHSGDQVELTRRVNTIGLLLSQQPSVFHGWARPLYPWTQPMKDLGWSATREVHCSIFLEASLLRICHTPTHTWWRKSKTMLHSTSACCRFFVFANHQLHSIFSERASGKPYYGLPGKQSPKTKR